MTVLFPAEQLLQAPQVSALVEVGQVTGLVLGEGDTTLILGEATAPRLEKRS